MTTPDANQDQILSMLDSIEEAIVEEAWSSSIRPPPATIAADVAEQASDALTRFPVPAPSAPPLPPPPRALVSPARRVHPDPPPRSAGNVVPVRGTTSQVLGKFQWGEARGAQ